MNWSGGALKATIGAGSLPVVAVLGDVLAQYVGVFGMIAIVLVPLMLLVFVKPGELDDKWVKLVHMTSVIWYLALVISSFVFMMLRGFGS